MRIAIVGAGAMGTLLGHGFCKAGHDVSLLDLPARVAQIRSSGKIIVVSPEGKQSSASPTLATTNYAKAGVHDVVILATKSQDLPVVARQVAQIADASTTIVTIQNGIPWWYLHGLDLGFNTSQIH